MGFLPAPPKGDKPDKAALTSRLFGGGPKTPAAPPPQAAVAPKDDKKFRAAMDEAGKQVLGLFKWCVDDAVKHGTIADAEQRRIKFEDFFNEVGQRAVGRLDVLMEAHREQCRKAVLWNQGLAQAKLESHRKANKIEFAQTKAVLLHQNKEALERQKQELTAEFMAKMGSSQGALVEENEKLKSELVHVTAQLEATKMKKPVDVEKEQREQKALEDELESVKRTLQAEMLRLKETAARTQEELNQIKHELVENMAELGEARGAAQSRRLTRRVGVYGVVSRLVPMVARRWDPHDRATEMRRSWNGSVIAAVACTMATLT